jgi:hypothetical protein
MEFYGYLLELARRLRSRAPPVAGQFNNQLRSIHGRFQVKMARKAHKTCANRLNI